MTSICDERGQELLYAGMPITEVFKQDMGIGGVLSLLWFQVIHLFDRSWSINVWDIGQCN